MKRITLEIKDEDFKKIKDMFEMEGMDFEKEEDVIGELFQIDCSYDEPLELKDEIQNIKIEQIEEGA